MSSKSFWGRLFGGTGSGRATSVLVDHQDELEREIVQLTERQLAKLAQSIPAALRNKLLCSFSSEILLGFVHGRAKESLNEMRPISDYASLPEAEFGMSVTVFPGSVERAQQYFLGLYPSEGFAAAMATALRKNETMMQMEKTLRGKKGVLFVVVCLPPEEKRAYVNVGLCPIAREFADSVPFVAPAELVPEGLDAQLKGEAKHGSSESVAAASRRVTYRYRVECLRCHEQWETTWLPGEQLGRCPKCRDDSVTYKKIIPLPEN